MDLEEVKYYLRVDDSDDDLLIMGFIEAAVSSLERAGVRRQSTNALYGLAIKMLVAHFYENRSIFVEGKTVNTLPYSVDCIINQLQLQ